MQKDNNVQRPIGYWLKHLDAMIETSFDRALADERVSRRDWQVLNILASGAADSGTVRAELAPFLATDASAELNAIATLRSRGWIRATHADGLELTRSGRRAHERLSARVGVLRKQMVHGVTDDEYRAVLLLLGRMAANLEAAAPPAHDSTTWSSPRTVNP